MTGTKHLNLKRFGYISPGTYDMTGIAVPVGATIILDAASSTSSNNPDTLFAGWQLTSFSCTCDPSGYLQVNNTLYAEFTATLPGNYEIVLTVSGQGAIITSEPYYITLIAR